MANPIELFAFHSNEEKLSELIKSGIDGIVVDWERKGKEMRQRLYNTQISVHDTSDLVLVHGQKPKKIICRINPYSDSTPAEIELAIRHGADEILLAMVRTVHEAEQAIEHVDGRVKVGLMLETQEALDIASDLDQLPVHRFFVGLMDLSIQRKSRNIFVPFIDGTLDELRPKISKKFGVAGLTHPLLGSPIPCKYLIDRMKYYQCTFAFLRRSFYRDLSQYPIRRILEALSDEFRKDVDSSLMFEGLEKLIRKDVI